MKDKRISLGQAVDLLKDGGEVMVGGFQSVGSPVNIVNAIAEKGVKDLCLICNDTSVPGRGVGRWVENRQVARFVGSHIGTNPESGRQMAAGELDVTLIPQGTMAEQMRAAGAGLGAVLTQTGLGTAVAKGKQTMWVRGKEYLVEEPISAPLAYIYGSVVDKAGNVAFEGTTRNFNVAMAKAAGTVVVEAQRVVEVGKIDPNHVVIPGIYIDYIVEGKHHGQSWD